MRVGHYSREGGHHADHGRRQEADHPVPVHRATPRRVAAAGPAGSDPWPDLRAVPEAAGTAEVTAGGPARSAPAVAQHGQLADLDAHVPFVRPRTALRWLPAATATAGGRLAAFASSAHSGPQPGSRQGTCRRCPRSGACWSFLEPGGQCVSLSLAPWLAAACADMLLELGKRSAINDSSCE